MRLNPSSDPTVLMQGFAAGWISKRIALVCENAPAKPAASPDPKLMTVTVTTPKIEYCNQCGTPLGVEEVK
jgi:hypothetical protein